MAAKKPTVKDKKPKIIPVADRVLLRVIDETVAKTASGIYIPETVEGDKGAKRATVVAVGEGRYENGKRIPVAVKVGDTVLFQWGDIIEFGGEKYFLVRENEISAIIK